MNKKACLLVVALVLASLAFVLCGCSATSQSSNTNAQASDLLMVDDPAELEAVSIAAQKVKDLDHAPRIVATSPAVAEICDKLDLDLVGICSSETSVLPDRYKDLPKVGTAMSPDMEKVGALDPDWILSPNSLETDLQPKYDTIDVEYAFLNLKSVQGMYRSIRQLGQIFDKESEADALEQEFLDFYRAFNAVSDQDEHPKVLILMGLPGSYVIATSNSYIGSLVEMAGGENVYSDQEEDFITVNTEDMQSKDPDIILRASHALPDQVMEMFADEFKTNDIWKHFDAVNEGKVYDLPNEQFGMSARLDYQEALDQLQNLLFEEEKEV